MDSVITFEEGHICRSDRPEGLLSFLVSRAKSAKRALTPSASEVLKGCGDAVDQILRTALETRNKADFDRMYAESFPKYAGLTMAISHFATAVIQKPVLEQLVRESICELEADFRDKGMTAFGATVRDQAMFTVWTLRKINDLTAQIVSAPLSKHRKIEDQEYCANFNVNALQAQFSLDCLNLALEAERPIYPEVLDELVDGLRAMVNAYTWARRGLEMRIPSQDLILPVPQSEDEDASLVDFSLSQAFEWLDEETELDAVRRA